MGTCKLVLFVHSVSVSRWLWRSPFFLSCTTYIRFFHWVLPSFVPQSTILFLARLRPFSLFSSSVVKAPFLCSSFSFFHVFRLSSYVTSLVHLPLDRPLLDRPPLCCRYWCPFSLFLSFFLPALTLYVGYTFL